MFADLVKRAPIPRIRLHDLRHTHASLLIKADCSAKLVSERLGHTSIKTTLDIYSHLYENQEASIADRFESIMSGAPEVAPKTGM